LATSEVERRVISAIQAVFANKRMSAPSINSTTVLDRTLGLESIDFAELVVRLETEFGADPFSEPSVGPVRTVADLAALYEKYSRPN
jgi:acyl carrier protein